MNTKRQLINLFRVLTNSTKIGNAKFKYGVLKNLKIINSEIESLKALETELSDMLKGYHEERDAIINKYGTPDGNGRISIPSDSENYPIVVKEINELEDLHKETLNSYAIKTQEYNDLLDEEVEFDFKTFEISIDNVPDEIEDLKILMDFEIVK